MSELDNGGPAFPDPGRAQSAKQREILTETGMTLRDYFAANIIQGLNANSAIVALEGTFEEFAIVAYKQADAMIAARGKPC